MIFFLFETACFSNRQCLHTFFFNAVIESINTFHKISKSLRATLEIYQCSVPPVKMQTGRGKKKERVEDKIAIDCDLN